jgi:hypothetical protein
MREAFREIHQRRRALIDEIHGLAYTNPDVLESVGISAKAARGLKRKRRLERAKITVQHARKLLASIDTSHGHCLYNE